MSTFQDVLSAARALDAGEQFRVASMILDSIPPESWPLPSAEWIAEAQRRSAEFDSGQMSASTWPEVQARSRRKAGLDE